jgi:hypothetical protein
MENSICKTLPRLSMRSLERIADWYRTNERAIPTDVAVRLVEAGVIIDD